MSIIRRNEERETALLDHFFDGPGTVIAHKIINSNNELFDKGRLFNQVTLEKDCGIGFHIHDGDGELYCVVSGEAQYEDTDHSIHTLYEGDVTITFSGEGHAITNIQDEPCCVIALILYN